tara:strand:+ start:16266 stop:16871 length:606 start_codon:yes stop_codon:yes gene_type:complete
MNYKVYYKETIMNARTILNTCFTDNIDTIEKVRDQNSEEIELIADMVYRTFNDHHRIFFCGNGGSAADCQHMAAEYVGRFKKERKGYPAIALTVDTSILTSVSNDYSYETIFARQLEALAVPGDLLIAYSTSGNSKNIIKVLEKAKSMGITSIGMTGQSGGDMGKLTNALIKVPSNITARIQEAHLLIGHIICEIVDQRLN